MFRKTSPASYIAFTLAHGTAPTPPPIPTHTHTHASAHTSTPSTILQYLNLRASPVRRLNTTDWDEWPTSGASISPLILLVWVAGPHLIPLWPPPLLLPASGNLRCFQSSSSGVPTAQHAETHSATMSCLEQVYGSCCTSCCHTSSPVSVQNLMNRFSQIAPEHFK